MLDASSTYILSVWRALGSEGLIEVAFATADVVLLSGLQG